MVKEGVGGVEGAEGGEGGGREGEEEYGEETEVDGVFGEVDEEEGEHAMGGVRVRGFVEMVVGGDGEMGSLGELTRGLRARERGGGCGRSLRARCASEVGCWW